MITHNTLLKRALTVIFGCSFLCLALSGCSNFLNAEKVSNEIKDAIAYNNARAVNVALSCKDEEGSLFPQPTYQAKLGYAFEVQFIPNTQNYLITDPSTMLKAVSRINDESRAEYVEFTPIEQTYEDKKSGLYRVNVKVVQYADDIKICPNGTLIPKVNEIYPPYNPSGYNQDTMIKVTFNKPVDPESFGNFSCIRFESAGQDISDCYGTPFFSSDNSVLNIPINPGKKILDENSQSNSAEVILKIACTNLKDAEGLSITQIESYTYCVNKNVDEIPPTIVPNSFAVTTTGDTNAWYYRTLTDKILDNWNDSQELNSDGTVKYYHGDYSRNHVGKTVHIKLQGYDNLDAIYGVRIREVFLIDSSGFTASENQEISYYDVAQTTREENRLLYSFDFDYEFKNRQNGLVKLEISLMDGAGKFSGIKTTYAVKSSDISRRVSFTLEADSKDSLPQLINGEYKSYLRVPENITKQGTLGSDQVYDFKIGTSDNFFGNYVSTCSSFKFILYDKNNNPVTVYEKKNYQGDTETSESIKSAINTALANYPIDTYRDTKARAVFYEENGITRELDFTIPAPGDIVSIQSGQILTTNAVILPSAAYMIYYVTCEPSDGSSSKIWKQEFTNTNVNLTNITSNTSSTNYPFGTYKVYVKESSLFGETIAEDCKIIRAFTKPFIYEKNATNSLVVNLRVDKKSLNFNSSKGMYDLEVNVTYPEDDYLYYLLVVAGTQIYISSERGKTVSFQYLGSENFAAYQYCVVKKHPQQGFVGITIPQSINISGNDDVYPPKLQFEGSGRHYYDSSYFYIDQFKIVNNNNSNSSNAETGDVEFICYYLPGYVGETPTVDILKAQAVYSRKIELGTDLVNTALKSAKIPFGDLNQGEYHLYAYLKDQAGNESCERLIHTYRKTNTESPTIYNGILFALKDGTPTATYNSNSSKIVITPPAGTNSTQVRMYRYRLDKDSSTAKWYWSPMENVTGTTDKCYSPDSASTAFTYETNHFIKVTTSEINKPDTQVKFDFYHYKPLYYFANYVKSPSSYPCNNATWMKVANGWQIFHDAPVFVHTMYSAIKITETTEKMDSLEWEARAHETGIVVYTTTTNTNFTYKDDNLAEVPDGNWYTTICHFADGTVLMSPVEQMHR